MSYFQRRKRKSMNIWHWVKQQTKIKTPPGARQPDATTCFFSWTGTARSSVRCATNTIVWTVEYRITVDSRVRSMRSRTGRIRMMRSSWSLSVDRNLNSVRNAITGCKSHTGVIKWSAGVGGGSAIYVEGTITNVIALRVIAEKRETNSNRINHQGRNEYHLQRKSSFNRCDKCDKEHQLDVVFGLISKKITMLHSQDRSLIFNRDLTLREEDAENKFDFFNYLLFFISI